MGYLKEAVQDNLDLLYGDLEEATDRLMELEYADPDSCSLYDEAEIWYIFKSLSQKIKNRIGHIERIMESIDDTEDT